MAFDAEMIIAIRRQAAFATRTFKNALRQGDAGRNLVLLHLLHGHILILLHIRAHVRLRVLGGNIRKQSDKHQQETSDTQYISHILIFLS